MGPKAILRPRGLDRGGGCSTGSSARPRASSINLRFSRGGCLEADSTGGATISHCKANSLLVICATMLAICCFLRTDIARVIAKDSVSRLIRTTVPSIRPSLSIYATIRCPRYGRMADVIEIPSGITSSVVQTISELSGSNILPFSRSACRIYLRFS